MSANRDRSQNVAFYYGNAVKDLAAYLPEEHPLQAGRSAGLESVEQREQIRDLERLLDASTAHLERMSAAHKEVSFLLSDLKKLL